MEPDFIRLRLDSETVEERKANLGRSLENAYDYLNLVAFIALLLGSIGVASSVHVYIKQKVNTLAVLRCLGAKNRCNICHLPDPDIHAGSGWCYRWSSAGPGCSVCAATA